MEQQTAQIELWTKMFSPRTVKWQKATLKRLKKSISPFETPETNNHKIQALYILLNI